MSARPLRIAIDATAIPRQMAGAGVYTYQLVRALAQSRCEHHLTVFARPGLFDDVAAQGRLDVVHTPPRARPLRLAWEQAALPFLLRERRIDVLHSPHHDAPLIVRAPVRRVVTVHDVTFLLLPDRYPLARRLYMEAVTRASARAAAAIITPSETVCNDVIRRLRVPAERVVSIPEAAAASFVPAARETTDRVRTKYGLPDGYILSVGSREPGKNRGRLLRAYARLPETCPLVIVGQPAWRYEEEAGLARDLGLSGRVRFLGYVPGEDLAPLYAGATLFAFPSLYEGFGLPVLEAMACGVPVVTSNISATAEVAGDAALLIDPRDEHALAEAMRRLLTDSALRGELRARGEERARQFSWQRAAQETLLVYELVAAKV